ncbi:hypothetical protein [Hymenobacter terricola]|uniref:hypothetical protein n=1 Tax=Hymenobacter terricola TaxID=2819236 RepID=UPI001B3169B8|nr:hypothetical protein [Hymenobacter terricola]
MGILSILGILFLVFIGKFIWDTYVTGETDRRFEVTKRKNPEEAARLENNVRNGHYLNFDYRRKSSPENRELSQLLLAAQWGCPSAAAEAYYKHSLLDGAGLRMPAQAIEQALMETFASIRGEKYTQARELNMDPDDTPAGLMQAWSREVVLRLREQEVRAFGLVIVSEMNPLKNLAPGVAKGITVVFTQSHRQEYSVRRAVNVALGIAAPTGEELRQYAELWTLEEVEGANEGNGLAVGDQVEGVAISILRSEQPFYAGQAACAETGLYHNPMLEHCEDGQPQDRFVAPGVTL